MFALTVLTGLATFSQTEELTKTYFAEGEKKKSPFKSRQSAGSAISENYFVDLETLHTKAWQDNIKTNQRHLGYKSEPFCC